MIDENMEKQLFGQQKFKEGYEFAKQELFSKPPSDEINHTCKHTCSGWEDGYTSGMAWMQKKLSWQLIATAPEDGTKVDLMDVDGDRTINCYWERNRWHYYIRNSGTFVVPHWHDLTHWMPIPEPPANKEKK